MQDERILVGSRVESAMLDLDWDFAPATVPARAAVQSIEVGDLQLTRMWLTAGARRPSPARLGRPRALLVAVAEGVVELSTRSSTAVVQSGRGALLTRDDDVVITTASSAAVVEMTLPSETFDADDRLAGSLSEIGDALAPLLSLIHALLNGDLLSGPAAPHWRRALLAGAVAASADSRSPRPGRGGEKTRAGSARTRLLERARHHIDLHYADTDLTAASLSRALNVSRVYLHKAAAAYGTTPLREIEAARAREARRLLHECDSPELGWVAKATGFTTTGRLQRALERSMRGTDG